MKGENSAVNASAANRYNENKLDRFFLKRLHVSLEKLYAFGGREGFGIFLFLATLFVFDSRVNNRVYHIRN